MPVKIDDLLVTAIAHLASDLHLKVGSFPVMRIGGELHPIVEAPRLSPEDTLDMAFSMMSNRQKQKLKEVSEVDIAYSVNSLGRFRANIFQQRGSVSIVLRVIPDQSRSTAALGLPPVIDRISEERRGLILVTGATGSGKSTTLAAMIDRINSTRSGHIVKTRSSFYTATRKPLLRNAKSTSILVRLPKLSAAHCGRTPT
jgi:twitching motility protein PilT